MTELPSGIRRKGTQFIVDVSVDGKRRTALCPSIKSAMAKQAELRLELANAKSKAWTLREALDKTIKTEWKDSKGIVTATFNAKEALDYFGDATSLSDITATHIEDYVEYLDTRGNSNATINRKLAALSKLFTTATKRGVIIAKPYIPKLKEGTHRIRFLTHAEEAKVLAALSDKQDIADAVTVLLDTGLRIGELIRLEARDIDLEHRSISVWVSKGDRPRSVPLTSRAHAILMRRCGQAPLFPTAYYVYDKAWQKVKKDLGLAEDTQFVIHALRHTFATRLVQKGVPIQVIQQLLGHRTIQMTMRYAHLGVHNLQSAIAALE